MFLENKKKITYSESVNGTEFVQEMVSMNYSEANLGLAKVLEEAFRNEEKVNLTKEASRSLLESVYAVRDQLDALEEICNLQEAGGLGFATWWKTSFKGTDNKIAEKVERKISQIKTEKDKKDLLNALEKTRTRIKVYNGTQDLNSEGWSKFWDEVKSGFSMYYSNVLLLGYGSLVSMIMLFVKKHNGSLSDFIKTLDKLIDTVKAYEVPEE